MSRRFRGTWAVVGAAVLTGLLLASALVFQRDSLLGSAGQVAASLSQVISEQTARTFQSVDGRLQLALERLDTIRRDGHLDPQSGKAVLRAEMQELPFVRALWVVDAAGKVVLETGDRSVGRSVADTAYFQAFHDGTATDLFIGPVQRSRTTGRWMVPVSRAVRSGDGTLLEVITAAVDPPYFEQLWRGVDLGTTGSIALFHRSGQLMMRTPNEEKLMGRDYSGLPLFAPGGELSHAPAGSFTRVSKVDEVGRILAYRQLPTYHDLVVVVGLGYDETLAPWRRFALGTAAVWAAASALALILAWQLRRQARSRERTEQRFRDLAQAMPQIVFVADVQGQVEFVNQRWVEVTGRSVDDALGTRWERSVHPDDRARMREALGQGRLAPRQLQVEHRLRCRDGAYRWQLLRAVPVREDGSGAQAWFGTATDIDELKRAQQRLHLQAEQLRLGGRLTRMGSWRVDLPKQQLLLSPEAAALLDLPPEAQPSLQEIYAMVAPASLELVQEAMRQCAERGTPFDIEVQLATHAGRTMWLRAIGEPVWDAQGQVIAIQGAQQDVTLRVLMMEEIRRLNAGLEQLVAERTSQLARQEALFRTLAEQAPLPFWTVDNRGQVTFLSRAWYEMAGGSPPQWHGHQWTRLIHPDDLPGMERRWIECARTGEPYTGTRRIRARDGRYHTTTYRAVPVRDDDSGEILFWVGVDADITDLMANEAALRLANKQLESFSYSVSHDLQSPLQRMASFARLLDQELAGAPAGKAHHYLARIQANAETMSQLIEGLLALAHVSEMDIIRTVVNVSDAATEILERLQSDDLQRRVAWQVQPGLAVMGDARLMRSVLENLIGNAWKFTSARADAAIEVGGSPERGEYFVRDNGCGFDMAYADRLFGTFQRLHSADEFPGTGIGLATVARAISRQGGRVWAQATPGEGATFFFTLPPA